MNKNSGINGKFLENADGKAGNSNESDSHYRNSEVRYPDGRVRLRNPHIELMNQDVLYHMALSSGTHNLVEMFGDIKFVCMGGSSKRMEIFAHYIMDELDYKLPTGTTLLDISQPAYRYAMYKVGPVLSVSHGMGPASLSILLHEVTKLMYHAKVKDPVFIRIGTSGGIGLKPGTVVVSEAAVDEMLRTYVETPILGKLVQRPATLDQHLARQLKACALHDDPFETIMGKTMCTNDFYESQGRLDGAICHFNEQDKMKYLNELNKAGVVNIEMECTLFAAFTRHAGIRSAIVCVTFLDRLKGDQVETPKDVLTQWQTRPQTIVSRYIKQCLQQHNGHQL
ncbi:uridine phosphorylase 1-like [Prorops nasuta]|uniref:uridine phosphorylase 1-like n=1 Tax=Prorops nasuta TaxID=863751 RepID=UPI0034CD6127